MFQETNPYSMKIWGPKKEKNLACFNAYTQLHNSAHTKDFQNVFQNSKNGSQVPKLNRPC